MRSRWWPTRGGAPSAPSKHCPSFGMRMATIRCRVQASPKWCGRRSGNARPQWFRQGCAQPLEVIHPPQVKPWCRRRTQQESAVLAGIEDRWGSCRAVHRRKVGPDLPRNWNHCSPNRRATHKKFTSGKKNTFKLALRSSRTPSFPLGRPSFFAASLPETLPRFGVVHSM